MHSQWLEVADRQAGVISTAQLTAAGVERAEMRRLTRRGALRSVDRAVWVVGPTSDGGDERLTALWVALLAAGPKAFAWRGSAAALWGFDGCRWPEQPEVAVSVPHHPRRPGIPRLRSLALDAVTVINGVPATPAVRTLTDLAVVVSDAVLERAVESGLRRGITSVGELGAAVAGRRSTGARRLDWILAGRPEGIPPTESDAETMFEIVARSAGVPRPRRQFGVLLRGRRCRLDFAWPEVRLAVEVDGSATHGPDVLDADLRRQNAIVLDGWLVLRFTWRIVIEHPELVRRDLQTAWAARSALYVRR